MDMKNYDEEIKKLNEIKDPDAYLTKTIELQDELSKESTQLNKEDDELFYKNQDLNEKLNKLMKSCEKKQKDSGDLGQKKAEIDAKIKELKADPVYSEKPALKARQVKNNIDLRDIVLAWAKKDKTLNDAGVKRYGDVPIEYAPDAKIAEALAEKSELLKADNVKIDARLKEIGDESGEKFKAIKSEITKLEKESTELGNEKDLIDREIDQMNEEISILSSEINDTNDRLKEIEAAIDKNNAYQEAVSAAYKQSGRITDEVCLEAGKSGYAANVLEEAKDQVISKAVIEASDPAAASSYIDAMKETNNDLENNKAEIKNDLFSKDENTTEKGGEHRVIGNTEDKSASLFSRLRERISKKKQNLDREFGKSDSKRNNNINHDGGPSGH